MRSSTPAERAVFGLAAAMVALHLALWAASALGVAWTRPLVLTLWAAFAAGVVVALGGGLAARHGRRWAFRPRPRFVAAAAGVTAFGTLALASWLGWNVHPDWAFHWGPKAQRFALAGGIDVGYLTRPWNLHVHPDYPNLVPDLTASLAVALGLPATGPPVTPRLGATVTLLFAALWFVSLRALAYRLVSPHAAPLWVREAAWLAPVWCATMFATGFRQAAGADLPFACAVTLGALALAAPAAELQRGRAGNLAVAVSATLASQIKFEGTVFAVVLVGLWLLRRALAADGRRRRRALLRAVWVAALLPALAVGAWWLWNQQYGLFSPSNAGALHLERLGAVARGLWRAATERAWHGVPLTLVALPWLCLVSRCRWPALLLAGQLAAYVAVYLTTPVDLDLLLLTSGSRLLFHLVPTFLVLLLVAVGTDDRPQASPERCSISGLGRSSDDPVSPSFLA